MQLPWVKYKPKSSKQAEEKDIENLNPIVVNTLYPDLNQYIENLYKNNSGASCFVMQTGSNLALTIHFGERKLDALKALSDIIRTTEFIQTLCLRSNEIGGKSTSLIANALSINKTLTSLDLACNEVQVSGAVMLASLLNYNTILASINISKCKIGDQGVESISSALEINRTLTRLDISDNNITIDGTKNLAKALKVNITLTEINLNKNGLQDSGAAILLHALVSNETLTHLQIGDNNIDKYVEITVMDKIKKNHELFTNVCTAIVIYLSGPEDAYLEAWVKEYYNRANPLIFQSMLESYKLLNDDNLDLLLKDKFSVYSEENNVTVTYRNVEYKDTEDSGISNNDLTDILEGTVEPDISLAGSTDSNNAVGCHCDIC